MNEIKLPEGPIRYCFAPDGKSVLVSHWHTRFVRPGNTTYSLTHMDVRTGKVIRDFGLVRDWGTVAISPNGRTAVSLFRNRLHGWDIAAGNERWSSDVTEWSKALAFAPDGRLLATGGRDGIVRLWDPANGKQVRELAGHDGEVSSLAWSRDGGLLVSAAGNVALIWDVRAVAGDKRP